MKKALTALTTCTALLLTTSVLAKAPKCLSAEVFARQLSEYDTAAEAPTSGGYKRCITMRSDHDGRYNLFYVVAKANQSCKTILKGAIPEKLPCPNINSTICVYHGPKIEHSFSCSELETSSPYALQHTAALLMLTDI